MVPLARRYLFSDKIHGARLGLDNTAESDAAAQPEVDLSSCSPAN